MQISNQVIVNPKADAEIPKRIKDVALEFESIFTNIMVKAMRGKENKDGLFKVGTGEKIFTEMLDTEYSKLISQHGSLGLADQIAKQMMELEGSSEKSSEKLNSVKSTPNRFYGTAPYSAHPPYQSPTKNVDMWQKDIDEISKIYGVDPLLVKAVIKQESAGNQFAVSPVGAKGLMQLMDTTASDLGVQSVFNGRENIMGGTKYLSQMLKRFDGDEELALAAYNAGPGSVEKYGNSIPPYKETQDYVRRVIAYKDMAAMEAKSE